MAKRRRQARSSSAARRSGASTASVDVDLLVTPGARVVLAVGDGDGWIYPFSPDAYVGYYAMNNAGDQLTLQNASGTLASTPLYTGSSPGVSWQLDPAVTAPLSVQNLTNWCSGEAPIAGTSDVGSPRSANVSCP